MANIFDKINKKFERQSKLKGFIISVIIHVVVLFISIPILGLKAPNPPLDGGGVEVNFGMADVGSGAIQPMNDNAQNAVSNPPPSSAASESSPEKDENIATQDVEDAPAIAQSMNTKTTIKKHTSNKKKTIATAVSSNTTVKTTKINNTPPSPPLPTVDERAIYKGAKGATNNSTSEGPDNVPGDKGMPNGDPSGKAYSGTPGSGGSGKGGVGYGGNQNLEGRKVIHRPIIHDDSQKFGLVAVRIKVDKTGKVIEAAYSLNGSTTNDAVLIKKAVQSAYEFAYSTSDIPEQDGTITFDFQGQ